MYNLRPEIILIYKLSYFMNINIVTLMKWCRGH